MRGREKQTAGAAEAEYTYSDPPAPAGLPVARCCASVEPYWLSSFAATTSSDAGATGIGPVTGTTPGAVPGATLVPYADSLGAACLLPYALAGAVGAAEGLLPYLLAAAAAGAAASAASWLT